MAERRDPAEERGAQDQSRGQGQLWDNHALSPPGTGPNVTGARTDVHQDSPTDPPRSDTTDGALSESSHHLGPATPLRSYSSLSGDLDWGEPTDAQDHQGGYRGLGNKVGQRGVMIIVRGLPGSGKTTLAR